jgi:hypothetical protein
MWRRKLIKPMNLSNPWQSGLAPRRTTQKGLHY